MLKQSLPSLTTLLWLLPFAGFMVGYATMSYFFSIESINTPSVIGLKLTDAFEHLSAHNLNPRLIAKKEIADMDEGVVLHQNPQPTTKIKSNQSVFLVVSTKPAQAQAPQLANAPITDSARKIQDENLRLKQYMIDGSYPKGFCIGQSPQPGQPLLEKKMIVYVCSGESKPVLMPNFKGKTIDEVVDFLNTYTITPTIMHTQMEKQGHRCDATCIVHDQRPLAGTLITIDGSKKPTVQLHVQ